MSHKHHNNNPFKNPDNLDENINPENQSQEEQTPAEENKEQNNELQEKYDTLNQQYLRLAADFDNYRKRQAHEREELLKYGAENA